MNLTSYLRRQDAEIVLLAEIDVDGATPLYIADRHYITEPGDVPGNTAFAPIIPAEALPRLAQRIPDLWGGRAVGSWGDLELVSQIIHRNGVPLNLVAHGLQGRSIRLRITGPRAWVPYADAQTIFSGRIGITRGSTDGHLTLTLEDLTTRLNEITVPPARYDAATMGAGFPAQNHGRARPMALGQCRNVSPVLIDATTGTYEAHAYPTGCLVAVDAVYDNGAVVTATDHGDGTFTLAAPPAGTVTCDMTVQVPYLSPGGNGYGTDDAWIVQWLLRTYAAMSDADIDLWMGDAETACGIYLADARPLGEVLDELARARFGWAAWSSLGRFAFGALQIPTSATMVINQARRLGEATWEDLPARYNRIPFVVKPNWTVMTTIAGSVDVSTAAYLRSEGLSDYIEDAADIAARGVLEAPLLRTLEWTTTAENSAAWRRALAWWNAARRVVKVSVPVNVWDWTVGIGGAVALEDTEVDGVYFVTSFTRTSVLGVLAIEVEAVG